MTVNGDEVPLADPADLAEQERELDEPPTPDPGDSLPEATPVASRTDAAEADVLEQAQVVRGDDDEYPVGMDQADEA